MDDGLVGQAADVKTAADLGALLRALRDRDSRRRGVEWTYRMLAKRTGWPTGSLSGYFAGTTRLKSGKFDALVRFLGADPAEQGAFADAHQRVAENRRGPSRSASTDGVPVPGHLPPDLGSFIGRVEHLAELTRLLPAHRGRAQATTVCTVSGTAGVGKTALVLHWGHRVKHRFPDGQLYLNLHGYDRAEGATDPRAAMQTMLEALGAPPQQPTTTLEAQTALYRSLLADRRVLVVLDNARDAAQVRPLLPGSGGCLAVVTSRDDLVGLVATGGAHPITLGLMSSDEARALLLSRIGAARVDAEPKALDRIVAFCAHLPLALAVVSARAAARRDLALGVLATQLEETRGTLDSFADRDEPTNLRAIFSWSYRTLTDPAAELFRLLGLHPGPHATVAAAANMTGTATGPVRALLSELLAASLLMERVPGHYVSHDLLRVFAYERAHTVDSADRRHAVLARLLDFYVHSAKTAARLVYPTRAEPEPVPAGMVVEPITTYEQAMTWFEAERPALLAAAEHAHQAGFDRHARELARALSNFLDRKGHWDDLIRVGRLAIETTRSCDDIKARARAHHDLSRALFRLNLFDEAQAELQHSHDLYERSGDGNGHAQSHLNLSFVQERQGKYADALDSSTRAYAHFQAVDNRRGQARALNTIGWHHGLLGDFEQARQHCQQALAIFAELGEPGHPDTWDSLGYANHHLGHLDQALHCYGRALEFIREIGDGYFEATVLDHLGDTHCALGDLVAADDAWQQAEAILTRLGHPDAEQVIAKRARATRP